MPDVELLLRLALSCLLGGIIGYERQSRRKSAGLRTNALVSLGSCLIMILSIQIYGTVEGKTNADPARLAAQVVSGIGFLGAGAIMKEGISVTGLTTAACLWVVAGVGLAVGAGYYAGAIATTLLILLTVGTLSRLNIFIGHEHDISLSIFFIETAGKMIEITTCLESLGAYVHDIHVRRNTNTEYPRPSLVMEVEVTHRKKDFNPMFLVDALQSIDGVLGVEAS